MAGPGSGDVGGPVAHGTLQGGDTEGPDVAPRGSTDDRVAAVDGTEPDPDGAGWGPLASALETLGLRPDPLTLALAPTLVGTSGAVTMTLAFAIFGKRRRDGEPPAPDAVLRAQAARGIDVASSGNLVRGGVAGSGASGVPVLGVVRTAAFPAPVDAEATMPRWRRPSLIEARKADPARTAASEPRHMSFDDSRVEPVQGYERRTIRYRVVRLLDAPDELLSADIGQLDQGDEVQLLEKWGAYWLVLCPDGRQGWLHKMTLGDVVDAEPSPTAAETWGAGDIDADVLAAFLAARARA